MIKDEILYEDIKSILIEEFEVEQNKIDINSHFSSDLGLDSLDMVDFSLALEKKIQQEIPVKKLRDIETIRDMMDVVSSL